MRSLTLVPQSPQGDELGRLTLPEALIAAAGHDAGEQSPSRREALGELHELIRKSLHEQGMEVALDLIDFQIAVSRALLRDTEGKDIELRLPVHPLPDPPEKPTLGGKPAQNGLAVLDNFFFLTELEGDSHE